MMSFSIGAVHLLAGSVGGTVGAIATCPLEVVKTRLQSSVAQFHPAYIQSHTTTYVPNVQLYTTAGTVSADTQLLQNGYRHTKTHVSLLKCLKHIVQTEGVNGLFKGLGPNLVGVAPSRAIYFFSYANMKNYLNTVMNPETPLVHIGSAVTAGFTACTLTNPIWFVKTRLQLDSKKDNSLTCRQCVKNIYQTEGVKAFYRGITASYFGVTETVIHFVIYEALKARMLEYNGSSQHDSRSATDFLRFMAAGAVSKTCATCVAYPHEVVRTRLREEGSKYKSFFQTLVTVGKEEGFRGLYRGLGTQLIRQIPNTALMMSTYELVVHLFSNNDSYDDDYE
ncbi:solute carrier family 25 member 36-like isoform X2 [Mytilus californianus]|uniref:solute carrier family 25 member 36-like isoform X2 n=1 Tax=Mytilus californianus TaxID=6549 RepID=UPI0022463021|nr:solute carrier family 25 member 36-like isoform X2 [Mytilus californianus]